MIEALILWGVLSGNSDRRREYLSDNPDEEQARDFILSFFFLVSILIWPVNLAIHTARLALAMNFKWGILLSLLPLGVGAFLFLDGQYLPYLIIGVAVSMIEMIRVGIRAIQI